MPSRLNDAPVVAAALAANRADPLATKLLALPRFYTHKDVLDQVFDGDEDAFTDAFCDGTLPPTVRAVVWEGGASWLNTLLLRRLVRQQNDLLSLHRKVIR